MYFATLICGRQCYKMGKEVMGCGRALQFCVYFLLLWVTTKLLDHNFNTWSSLSTRIIHSMELKQFLNVIDDVSATFTDVKSLFINFKNPLFAFGSGICISHPRGHDAYYPNTVATQQIILLSGDIGTNPGDSIANTS